MMQAICFCCWEERFPGREPEVFGADVIDLCAFCGDETTDGIYAPAAFAEDREA